MAMPWAHRTGSGHLDREISGRRGAADAGMTEKPQLPLGFVIL